MFGGTQEKCIACKKTVYPIEKVWHVRHEKRDTSISN